MTKFEKLAKEHLRVEEVADQVFVINPHADMEGFGTNPRTPRAQVSLICGFAKRMAAEGKLRTLMWDTVSNTARQIIREVGEAKVNRDEHSKNYRIDMEGEIVNTPGINWRDNGMAQNVCRYNLRDPLLHAPEPFHVHLLGHAVSHEDGNIGFDIGGPASAKDGNLFSGGKFTSFLYVGTKKGGERFIATRPLAIRGFTVQSLFKAAPGRRLKLADDNGIIEIPTDDYEASVEIWRDIMETQGTRLYRGGCFGDFNAGKTALTSAFLGLPDTKPAYIVESDQQLDLTTFWPQVLNKAKGDK